MGSGRFKDDVDDQNGRWRRVALLRAASRTFAGTWSVASIQPCLETRTMAHYHLVNNSNSNSLPVASSPSPPQ